MKNQNDGKQSDKSKTAPQSGQPGRSDQSQEARAQHKKFESTSEAGGSGQGATGPNSGKSANSSASIRESSSDIDDQRSVGRADRNAGRGSSDEDTMTGRNPSDPSMVEATGEAKGDEGEETGGTGKSGYGKR